MTSVKAWYFSQNDGTSVSARQAIVTRTNVYRGIVTQSPLWKSYNFRESNLAQTEPEIHTTVVKVTEKVSIHVP